MNVFFIILGIILLLLFFPITLRGELNFDVSINSGDLLLKFFRLNVYRASISISKDEITLISGNKHLSLHFSQMKGGTDFKTRFVGNLVSFAKYNNCRIFGSVGIVDNAMASSLTSGFVNICLGGVLSFATRKLKIKNYSYRFFPSFFTPAFNLYLSSSITINFATILYSAIS